MHFTHLSRILWRFIKPEIEEVIIYTLTIVGFTVIAFYQTVVSGSIPAAQNISDSFGVIQDNFAFITSGDDTVAKLFTFGTWFIIGTFVYMIAWFLISFANGAFKDIAVSNSYVHPRSFDRSSFWISILARVALQITAAISFIIYISVWLSVLAPAWMADFREIYIADISLNSIYDLTIAILGILVTLHIGAIIFRVILLRSKYFYHR